VTVSLSGTAATVKPSATGTLSSSARQFKSTPTSVHSGTTATSGTAASIATNAAALESNPLPIWGVIIGFGVQLAGMNM
jgi:hypothetical protein